jgi:hypothetical protein
LRTPSDIAVRVHRLFDPGEKFLLVEDDFGEKNHLGRIAFALGGQPAGGRYPSRMPAHHFEYEHLGRSERHGCDIEGGLSNGHGHVLGNGTKTGAAIGDRQIIVYGLGDAHTDDGITESVADLRHLVSSIGGITAAIVKEVTHIVGLKDIYQALVLGAAFSKTFELVAARTEGACRCVA